MSAFDEVINFTSTGTYKPVDFLFRAETRTEISARLLSWAKVAQQHGYSYETSFFLTSVVGELANNAFDHNLGKWTDQIGCLISFDFLPDRMRMAIVDRGQGIVDSLKSVRPNVHNKADYLTIAFEDIVSGRAPEQRGNGLKYVRKNFLKQNGFELLCISSGYQYKQGQQNQLETALASVFNFKGTLVAIDWNKAGL